MVDKTSSLSSSETVLLDHKVVEVVLSSQFLTLEILALSGGGMTGSVGGRGIWGFDESVISYTAHYVPSPLCR